MKNTLKNTLLTGLATTLLIAAPMAKANDGEAIVKKARCVACHAV